MKLNLDCMRDVMLEVEKQPYDEELDFHILKTRLRNYSENDLSYTCLKLQEAGFIEADISRSDNFTRVQCISDLTYEGHQFLANIRESKVWTTTKTVMGKIGATSIQAATQIATSVVTEIIKQTILPLI